MATVTPSRTAPPVKITRPLTSVETATIGNADDLVLTKQPGEEHRTLVVTASAATTTLNSISSGDFVGQRLTLIVENITNALVVPVALGNVAGPVNISVDDENPKTLVWDGAAWRLAA